MLPNTAESTKICTVCRRALPLGEFRRRRAGTERRESRCRECYNAWSRNYRRQRKLQTVKQFARRVRRQADRDYIVTALDGMLRSFGGWQNFIAAWTSSLLAEAKHSRPRRFLGDSLLAIIRLMDLCESSRPPTDYSLLSESDLEIELSRRIRAIYGESSPDSNSAQKIG